MAQVAQPNQAEEQGTGYSSAIVAEQFVRQYFLILQNSPWQLHHFYNDLSVYTVQPSGSMSAEIVQGATNIGQRIQESLPNVIQPVAEGKECSCEIKNLRYIHQVSLPGSIVVAVSGIQVSPKTGQSQRFYQTFVLAKDLKQENAYYVHNDMVSFEQEMPVMPPHMVQIPNGAPPMGPGPQGLVPMSPPGVKPKPVPVETKPGATTIAPVPVPVPAPPPVQVSEKAPPTPEKESSSPKFGTVPEDQLGPPAQLDIGKPTIPASATPVVQNPTADPTEDDTPEAGAEEPAPEAEAKEEPKTTDDAEEQVEEPSKETAAPASPGPMSWAGVAAAHKPEVKPAPQPKPARKPTPPPESADTDKQPAEEVTPAPRKERTSYKAQDDLDASVFVSGVPNTCDEDKLKEIFGKHGDVVKVSLKAEKHYAIIDFNSSDAVGEALKETIIKCDSSIMKVEARRRGGATKSRGKGESRSSGDRGRGRGRDGGSKGGSRRGGRDAH
jgi:hypothetical protein